MRILAGVLVLTSVFLLGCESTSVKKVLVGNDTLTRSAMFHDGTWFSSEKPNLQSTMFTQSYNATKRSAMVFVEVGRDDENKGQIERVMILGENPPDAAKEISAAIAAALQTKGDVGEVKVSSELQTAIVQLGDRTATVNMLRDSLYRLNEASLNSSWSQGANGARPASNLQNYDTLFSAILDTVKAVSANDEKIIAAKGNIEAVRAANSKTQLQLALLEELKRKDLGAEERKAYLKLLEEPNSKTSVSNPDAPADPEEAEKPATATAPAGTTDT